MSLTTFANPIMLPWFKGDEQQPDILCGGAIYHAYPYDGTRNLVELTPIRHDPRIICAMESNAVGEKYTIGAMHLQRLILVANYAAGIFCENCGRPRSRVTATVCCNTLLSNGLTFRDLMNEVRHAATEVARTGSYSDGGSVTWEAGQWINAHLEEWRGMVDQAKGMVAT